MIATCEFNGRLLKLDLATPRDRIPPARHHQWRRRRHAAGHPLVPRRFSLRRRHEGEWRAGDRSGELQTSRLHRDGKRNARHLPESRRETAVRDQSRMEHAQGASRRRRIGQRGGSGRAARRRDLAPVPGGGSPDMGNVTADGRELWVSGRYDHVVYVFDTATGAITHRIAVGKEPHGLCVWPQPGRYSLGHTGKCDNPVGLVPSSNGTRPMQVRIFPHIGGPPCAAGRSHGRDIRRTNGASRLVVLGRAGRPCPRGRHSHSLTSDASSVAALALCHRAVGADAGRHPTMGARLRYPADRAVLRGSYC